MNFESGLLDLTKVNLEGSSIDEALGHIARISALTLGVQRVSFWAIETDGAQWRCLRSLDVRTNESTSGRTLDATRYPEYARALNERRIVAVDDTRAAPMSAALRADYFEPLHITASLDVPVYRAGRVAGIVCHEAFDGPHLWSERERSFAATVAEIVGALFEQAARVQAERRLAELEAARRASEKMEALGRMAAAVAHDFNNVLAVLQLLHEKLARSDADRAARARTLALLQESTDVGQRLTRRLVAFARAEEIALEPLRLSELVNGSRAMVETLLAPTKVEFFIDDRDDEVNGDRVGLEQVLVNLVTNARDAIGRRAGCVTVRVRSEPTQVSLVVQDDGEGMDDATRARIFEPFFSTRPRGANAGLGMATVFRIVEAHHGAIDVRSSPGQGTTIDVRLPRRRASQEGR